MALVAAKIKKELESKLFSALSKEFKDEQGADPKSHKKMAAAIADAVSDVIVTALTTEAQVLPGIATAGSPAAQTTTTPGKIS